MVFSRKKNRSLPGDSVRKTMAVCKTVDSLYTLQSTQVTRGSLSNSLQALVGAGCTTGVPDSEDFWTSSINSISSLNCMCIYNFETIFIGPLRGLLRKALRSMYVNGHSMESLGGRPAIRSYLSSSHQPFLIKHCCKNDISTQFSYSELQFTINVKS